MSGEFLLIYICNFLVLSHLLLNYIFKLDWKYVSWGNFLLICIWNFHVLRHLLLIYICKLHWISHLVTIWVSRGVRSLPPRSSSRRPSLFHLIPARSHRHTPLGNKLLIRKHGKNRILKKQKTEHLRIGKLLLIYICNFHVLSNLLMIYICKLHWNLNTMFVCQVNSFWFTFEISMS